MTEALDRSTLHIQHHLSFRGKIYQQVHGTAMGSLVLVVVANLVMEDIEQKALSTFYSPPCFWKQYVDDTCTILPGDLVDSFHSHLNSIDNNIQFTVEKESYGQLPFLDILLTREEDGSVSTSVYRKTTHTDQYLNFESHYPVAHKKAVVKTLLHRADALSSSGVSRAEEEKHVTKALQRNGYPISFIRRHTIPTKSSQVPDSSGWCASLTLPYLGG